GGKAKPCVAGASAKRKCPRPAGLRPRGKTRRTRSATLHVATSDAPTMIIFRSATCVSFCRSGLCSSGMTSSRLRKIGTALLAALLIVSGIEEVRYYRYGLSVVHPVRQLASQAERDR